MHQQIRTHHRVLSPASSAQTNPSRTNNPREGRSRSRAGSSLSVRDAAPAPVLNDAPGLGPYDESIKKLDQIVQNIFAKASTLILHSRMTLRPLLTSSGSKKTSKWTDVPPVCRPGPPSFFLDTFQFQADTEDFEEFREDLRLWRTCGSFENRPTPLFIDIYLDTAELKPNESLVLVDDNGKRWDVVEILNSYDSSSGSSGSGGSPLKKTTQVVLERWRIELKCVNMTDPDDFGPILPTIYKKAIVFIRSIYTYVHLLPCWKLVKQTRSGKVHPALVPRCRVRATESDGLESSGVDRLRQPLTGSGKADAVTDYVFGDLEVPVGRFYVSVTYRTECNCNFRVDDPDAVMGSRFIGLDENLFRPSLPPPAESDHRVGFAGLGSLPTRQRPSILADVHQTYGSLSTFHGDGPLGTSPMSALRGLRPPGSDSSEATESVPASPELDPPRSLPTSAFAAATVRPTLRPDLASRRPSISFQPFKSGPILAGSLVVRPHESEAPVSPQSISRIAGLPTLSSQPRTRTSLTAGMPASLRGAPVVSAVPEQTVTSSPRPTSGSRVSSSFTHRRGRPSASGTSRTGDDEQGSSGRQSPASSSVAQPGSGFLTEVAGTSSGSLQASDDNIAEFLRAIDSKRTLKSLDVSSKRVDLASSRTVAQLSRFHLMKESNNALTESMISSAQMQRSSSSSSRQLMVGGPGVASLSESPSPGKPISPHAPHTPAVPSKLSENSIIAYDHIQARRASSRQTTTPQIIELGPTRENTITQLGTTAIDIPLSPRLGARLRRSSSVAHPQPRSPGGADDEDHDPAFLANRSVSLGAHDREPPTIGMLLGRPAQVSTKNARKVIHDPGLVLDEIDSRLPPEVGEVGRPHSEIRVTIPGSVDMTRQNSSDPPGGLLAPGLSSSPYGRRRYVGMSAASTASTNATVAPSARRQAPSAPLMPATSSKGRGSSRVDEVNEDEPLVFAMSEMDPHSRRSIEEGRGGGQESSFNESAVSQRRW